MPEQAISAAARWAASVFQCRFLLFSESWLEALAAQSTHCYSLALQCHRWAVHRTHPVHIWVTMVRQFSQSSNFHVLKESTWNVAYEHCPSLLQLVKKGMHLPLALTLLQQHLYFI